MAECSASGIKSKTLTESLNLLSTVLERAAVPVCKKDNLLAAIAAETLMSALTIAPSRMFALATVIAVGSAPVASLLSSMAAEALMSALTMVLLAILPEVTLLSSIAPPTEPPPLPPPLLVAMGIGAADGLKESSPSSCTETVLVPRCIERIEGGAAYSQRMPPGSRTCPARVVSMPEKIDNGRGKREKPPAVLL